MCGICGFSGGPNRGLLRQMTEALSHRGPDDSGYIEDANWSLGVRRLSIIDVPGGHQPMGNEDGTIWTVYNGEIYNFRGLRRELELKGHQFTTNSDTETIVHAYEQYDFEFVKHLSGMFAIAISDQRKRRLVLARDRIGMKPLYYALCGSGIAFASEIKALLLHPEVQRLPDAEVLRLILSFGYSPDNRTPFQGVAKLPPGHLMVWENGRSIVRPYWTIPRSRVFVKDEQLVIALVRKMLTETVASHLVSDVPVGIMLSGGLDSSIVTALARKATPGTLKTFTFVYAEQPETADRAYAKEVAQYLDTEHQEIEISGDDMLNLMPTVVYHHDEPKVDAASFPTLATARQLRKEVKVVLVGEGSDEQFGGYYSHTRFAKTRMIRRLVPKFVGADLVLNLVDTIPGLRKQSRALEYLGSLDDGNLALRLMNSPVMSDWEYSRAVDPGFFAATRNANPSQIYDSIFRDASIQENAIPGQVDLKVYIPNDISMKVDKMTMAASVEARMPFLDYTLIDYTPTVDPRLKTTRGVSKYLLRRAFADMLPRSVLRRSKQTIQVPVALWIKNQVEAFENLVFDSVQAKRCPLTAAALSRIVARVRGSGDLRAGNQLFALAILETWYRLYVDPDKWKAAPLGA